MYLRAVRVFDVLALVAMWMLSVGCALPHAQLRSDASSAIDGTIDGPEASACDEARARCGDRCVSLDRDPQHCGECDRACVLPNAIARCERGACAIDRCAEGFGDCDGDAANGCEQRLDSAAHCGMCRARCEGATPICDGATRRCATGCSVGQSNCDGACVDTQTNVLHCGGCGRSCSLSHAIAACASGACTVARCQDGYADCDRMASNGCETALLTEENCARCGDRCAGGTPLCDAATRSCSSGCSAGSTRCGATCVDTLNNPMHCGGCGRACSLANASARCQAGACVIESCMAGFADCDGNPVNGCEVNLQSSSAHCGACGRRCEPSNATASCRSGVCGYSSCSSGFADCDGTPANGCEVDTRSSITHCGACGAACTPVNATALCTAGACSYVACTDGYGDCDRNRPNGCEVDLRTSVSHCGACGNRCERANASAVCSARVCSIGECNAGFANCDNVDANGCEAALATSIFHCGACGVACLARPQATPRCVAGACSFNCVAGFGDCNGLEADGCESALNDLVHCGACGVSCSLANATATCATRQCRVAMCDANWGNCNNMDADGCETDLLTSANHCGRCGTRCASGQRCVGGACMMM